MTDTTGYPARWESHAVLKDGSPVELRPIRADDRAALDAFHKRQSKESIYFRYFRHHPELTDNELDHFTQVDYRDRMAFVALIGHELVAVARYERWPDRDVAEVAFFVDDGHHGLGLATLMLEYLAAAARENGLAGFTASVLPENYGMLAVFRSAGFEAKTRFADGVIEVDLGIEVTPETSEAIADRHRRSSARSVARMLEPASVAVIGASRTAGNVGHELIRQLVRGAEGTPLAGHIHPVNIEAAAESSTIAGIEALPTIAAATEREAAVIEREGAEREGAVIERERAEGEAVIEREGAEREAVIDLAVVAVRAELVEGVVAECAEAGVRGLLIVSTGVGGRNGADGNRPGRLAELARDNGMRLIGPASFGLINTDPDVGLTALFHPVRVHPGRVGLASESGPLGAAVLERLRARGIGMSTFVGVGERADVSTNDLLHYWDLDPNTEVIVLYVESYGNLRNFSTVARRVSATKPIVAIAPSDPDLIELLRQSGVILVDEVPQLVDQARLAVGQPVAAGNRIVVVSNTASVARLAVDGCRRSGLNVTVPGGDGGTDALDAVLIGDLDTVSLMPSSDPGDYEPIIVAAAASDEVDAVLIALAPTAYLGPDRLAQILDRVNRSVDKPVVAIGLVDSDRLDVEGLPVFSFPEEAARTLGRHVRYGQWRAVHSAATEADETGADAAGQAEPPSESLPPASESPPVVDELLAGRSEARLNLASDDVLRLIDGLAIPVAPFGVANDLDEAEALAARIGYPVAIKAGRLSRRSVGESGGAAIDLHGPDELRAAYRRMCEALGLAMQATVVQKMIPATDLARLDLLQEASFGSMISLGHGGTAAEDVPPSARRFLPIDRAGAEELVDALVDDGVNLGDDADGAARHALVDLVLAVDAAAARTNRLVSVSLNPIMVAGADTAPVDIEIHLRSRPDDPLAGLRSL